MFTNSSLIRHRRSGYRRSKTGKIRPHQAKIGYTYRNFVKIGYGGRRGSQVEHEFLPEKGAQSCGDYCFRTLPKDKQSGRRGQNGDGNDGAGDGTKGCASPIFPPSGWRDRPQERREHGRPRRPTGALLLAPQDGASGAILSLRSRDPRYQRRAAGGGRRRGYRQPSPRVNQQLSIPSPPRDQACTGS